MKGIFENSEKNHKNTYKIIILLKQKLGRRPKMFLINVILFHPAKYNWHPV